MWTAGPDLNRQPATTKFVSCYERHSNKLKHNRRPKTDTVNLTGVCQLLLLKGGPVPVETTLYDVTNMSVLMWLSLNRKRN
jgi:hypothetical protein